MIQKLISQICEIFVGKEEIVQNVLICLLAGGHILLEDVPGVGKTTLARTLAGCMDASFGRIQFTPDTLPSDVVGVSIYDMKTGEFSYKEGAIMHQLILADEINRTSPKTQAALLEAMAEGQVTIDGKSFQLPCPFMVIATQNPSQFLGTFPLPEAQMDRFMMRLSIGYPAESEELRLARNYLDHKTADHIRAVCGAEDILNMQKEVSGIHVSDAVVGYIRQIVALTRSEKRFVMGASPRAMLHLISASQAKAYMQNRDFVKPYDVKAVACEVLSHRLSLSTEARIQGDETENILKSLILTAKIPME